MLNIAVWIFKKQMWFHCLYPQITHAKADCETFKYAYTLKCSFAGSPGEGILCGLGKIVHHDGVVLFEEAFWERAFQNQSSPSWSQRLCGGGQPGRVLLCPLGWHLWLWRSPGRDGCSHDLVPAHTPLLCHLSCSRSAALLCSNLCCNTFPVSGSTRGCHQGGSLVRKAAAAPASPGCLCSARWLSHLGRAACRSSPSLPLWMGCAPRWLLCWVQGKRLHVQILLCSGFHSNGVEAAGFWGSCLFCSMGVFLMTSQTWD